MIPLSDEQQLLVDTVTEITEEEFEPNAFDWDEDVPWPNLELMADRGLLGINFPERYGGGGMSEFEVILMNEVVGRVCPDTARALNSLHMVAPRAINKFGTETAKEKYLPGLTDAEYFISIVMSEPEAGSDVRSMNTEITEDGGDLYANGEKTWVSYVPDARAGVVWAKFPDGSLGTVIMDFDDPGVDIASEFTNMAGHTQVHMYMEDVYIPDENVLTRGAASFKQMLTALNWERLAMAVIANSLARCALEKALEYAQQREQFGRPIGDFQGIEWKLADMTKEYQASRGLIYDAVRSAVQQDGVPEPVETHIANLYAGEMAERVVSESLQIHGANGYQRGHPLEYLYRLQRGYRIAGGTDEIQKNTVANLLKKEGVPSLT